MAWSHQAEENWGEHSVGGKLFDNKDWWAGGVVGHYNLIKEFVFKIRERL